MRYTGPKAHIVRRFGMNLFGSEKYDKILAKRNFPPGMHGKKRFSKPSEFGKQLLEKQKARYLFGITERQCLNYYSKALKKKGETGKAFMQALERRFDNVVFRAGFAKSRPQSRQMASHGLFTVNGRRVNAPSLQVKINDKIAIRTQSKNSPLFENLEKRKINPPSWLKVDVKEKQIEVIRLPDTDEFEKMVEPQLIVEYYSK